jgi:hypothetical protein
MTDPLILTDDEAIATAMLLGCEFYCADRDDLPGYFVHGDNDNLHPVEKARKSSRGVGSDWAWRTKSDLARDYIKFTLEGNDGA